MLRTKRVIAILLACVLTVAAPISISADDLMISGVKQAMSNWCWAACDEMCGQYEVPGSGRTQYDVVPYIYDSSGNYQANSLQTAQGAEYVTYFNADYTAIGSQFTESQVQYYIDTVGNPFICGVFGHDWGHFVVVAGYDAGDVKVIDPWTSSSSWVDYSALQTWNGGSWATTIYTSY